ncbi:MAG: NAD(P)H-binding protein [Anaerolineaceae bacterium]|nr:NAD(P)H-binding protein [Anaerolineaceae bacterium]
MVKLLIENGFEVRTLLKPSQKNPNLPKGIPVEAVVCSLNDERGLRAALKGIEVVFHLAGSERLSSRSDLMEVDVIGTRTLLHAARKSKISQLIYLSHLGADQNSAFPVLKAKALAEKEIVNSGVPYTIFRTSHIYGKGDQFVEAFAKLLRLSPGFFLVPGKGDSALQPLSVNDLVACLNLSIMNSELTNKITDIGGGEVFTFREIIEIIMNKLNIRRYVINVSPAYLRMFVIYVDQLIPKFPISLYWLDSLSEDRTTALDILPRQFGILPARFTQSLDFLTS